MPIILSPDLGELPDPFGGLVNFFVTKVETMSENKKHYFLDALNLIIYWANTDEPQEGLRYLGASNNKNPKKAAAFFVRSLDRKTGYKILELV